MRLYKENVRLNIYDPAMAVSGQGIFVELFEAIESWDREMKETFRFLEESGDPLPKSAVYFSSALVLVMYMEAYRLSGMFLFIFLTFLWLTNIPPLGQPDIALKYALEFLYASQNYAGSSYLYIAAGAPYFVELVLEFFWERGRLDCVKLQLEAIKNWAVVSPLIESIRAVFAGRLASKQHPPYAAVTAHHKLRSPPQIPVYAHDAIRMENIYDATTTTNTTTATPPAGVASIVIDDDDFGSPRSTSASSSPRISPPPTTTSPMPFSQHYSPHIQSPQQPYGYSQPQPRQPPQQPQKHRPIRPHPPPQTQQQFSQQPQQSQYQPHTSSQPYAQQPQHYVQRPQPTQQPQQPQQQQQPVKRQPAKRKQPTEPIATGQKKFTFHAVSTPGGSSAQTTLRPSKKKIVEIGSTSSGPAIYVNWKKGVNLWDKDAHLVLVADCLRFQTEFRKHLWHFSPLHPAGKF